jgi:hypothetical protein
METRLVSFSPLTDVSTVMVRYLIDYFRSIWNFYLMDERIFHSQTIKKSNVLVGRM